MNYSDEEYVRLYTRDTPTWRLLGWEGRTVLLHMLRGKFDRAGVFEVAGVTQRDQESHIVTKSHDMSRVSRSVRAVTELPVEVVEVGLRQVLEEGVWLVTQRGLFWPRYIEAQSCKRSDRVRKQSERARRAAESERSVVSRGVTECHEMSQASRNVTPEPYRSRSLTGAGADDDDARAHTRTREESNPGHSSSSPQQLRSESTQDAFEDPAATGCAEQTQTLATDPATPQQPVCSREPTGYASCPQPDPDRETICPLNLALPADCVADIAEKLGAEPADVLAVQQEFLAYWTIGGGAGKRRRNWPARLRQEVLERHKRGQLIGLGSADAGPPIARGKRNNVSENQATIARVAARMRREKEANGTSAG